MPCCRYLPTSLRAVTSSIKHLLDIHGTHWSLPTARQMRLKVLGSVIQSLDGENQAHLEILAGLVGEVLLCLKDANGKAREAAYQTLSTMAQVKKQDDLAEFSQIVLAALAAETPHMRSAAVRLLLASFCPLDLVVIYMYVRLPSSFLRAGVGLGTPHFHLWT